MLCSLTNLHKILWFRLLATTQTCSSLRRLKPYYLETGTCYQFCFIIWASPPPLCSLSEATSLFIHSNLQTPVSDSVPLPQTQSTSHWWTMSPVSPSAEHSWLMDLLAGYNHLLLHACCFESLNFLFSHLPLYLWNFISSNVRTLLFLSSNSHPSDKLAPFTTNFPGC